jgi:nucleotide-binding universal stress UspA family protein
MALVVVGVDGSEGGAAALRFAADEAAFRDAKLRVVCAWELPASVYTGTWAGVAEVEPAFEKHAGDIAARALSEAARLQPGIDREWHTARGQPADVLVRESQDADLLVVGTRGLGGFKSLLLGSVSQQVAHHASCPVVIVPPPATCNP